jgi:hypothetical protein
MSTDKHTIVVLAHEPGHGWITFAVVHDLDTAQRAEIDALTLGFDEVRVA